MKASHLHHIQTAIHGQYLTRIPNNSGANLPLLIGFHGYAENAEIQMDRLRQIPGVQDWLCCSVQALHSFYNREGKTVASWLTSEGRDFRIQENTDYINRIISKLRSDYPLNNVIVYCGFSQGTAMACRAALLCDVSPRGVIILGGDIPPEFNDIRRMSKVLLGRGEQDQLYSNEYLSKDLARVKQANIEYSVCSFQGGHYWSKEFSRAAGDFLASCYNPST